jgi:cysteinyl-tRNA synthetase
MALEIYNTLTRKKEAFTPVREGHVGMYICGPTVYSDAHVGHAKAYLMGDIVNRYLRFLGYDVTYVQNITDVGHMTNNDDVAGEDKLEIQSRKERKHPMAVAEYYTRRYFEDMDKLNILRPDISPRATGHIIEQIELIKKLIENGCAYEVDGNVYFDIARDKDYGKLSGRKTEEQEASGRVEARSDKRSPQDFALWKRADASHIMRWPSPWGEGFPGWHIECSAMSMKYLGETIDIHGGGIENQFPHHECEIAQSECATGKPFVKYWMHNNMVTTGGVKMGKSLGNSAYLRDLFQQYNPLSLRFTILQSHYRSTTEFTEEAINAAETGYKKLLGTYQRLKDAVGNTPLLEIDRSTPIVFSFIQAMNDDFNTAKALAVLYDLSTETNQILTSTDRDDQASILASNLSIWNALAGTVLGILPTNEPYGSNASPVSDELMQLLIRQRKAARDRRDFATSDSIRKELEEVGVLLEDTKDGTTWRLK